MTDISQEARVFLIRKHGGYYRPNSQGYTDSAIMAGRYTKSEAEGITHPNGPDGPRDGMTYIHEDEVTWDEGWTAYRAQAARIAELEENEDRFVDGIKAVRQYGSDTLIGPTNRSDDTRDWQRASVIEMTKRCRLLLSGYHWNAEDDDSTHDEVALKTETPT